ncbi:MAG: hemin ABC transporter substrate-binding protein [Oricola sp.]
MKFLFRNALGRERTPSLFGIAACTTIVIALLAARAPSAHAGEAPQRVLSIGSAITEIIFALGEQDRLVGRDSTSTYPDAALALPDVGYMRALAPEGVLSIRPDLIVASEGSGPPETIEVLKSASIRFVEVPERHSADGVDESIRIVAKAMDAEEKGAELRRAFAAQMVALAATVGGIENRKHVLFILSMQDGRILAAGRHTAADGMIGLAGAENAIAGYDGYKQLTDEALLAADPDVVLMMDRGGEFAIDDATLWSHPGLKTTTAARNKAVIRMNGSYLLGFGPRTAAAALDLAKALYGDDLR